MKNIVLPVIATVITMSGCGCTSLMMCKKESGAQSVSLTEADSGKTLRIGQDATLRVCLPGNRSTGFVWEVVNSSILSQQGEPDAVPNSSAIGAGATYIYSFRAVRPGTATLKMVYRRPWEIGAAPLRSFEIAVIVTSYTG
ncbi:protease inhibitor I42 family protein [Geomonas anaerohicana]|uniref:Protease inhibitor I42 family protein n=1 Tax=Geomonas anaerohicana TaxID=2798583 RepID=A0ABS0Y8S9_9BACT|nr:protease inhibitor I42 family protein [Geomonas anaerohicana]MBJ6748705.1 protease inhibitor I42 family protein [Geomonas anaerohicana]